MTGSLQIKNKHYIVMNTYENGKRKIQWINTGFPVKGNKTRAQKLLREALEENEQAEERRAQQEATAPISPLSMPSKCGTPIRPRILSIPLTVLDACLSGVLAGNIFSQKQKEKSQNLSVSELFLVRVRRFELPAS